MAAAMPRGLRILQSCRGLAIRAAPACSRTQALPQLARHARLQSNDAKSRTSSASGSIATGAANAATETSSPSNPIESIDDAELAEILYGGRGAARKDGGLTEAQEEVLYRDGEIPSAQSAEAVLAVGDVEAAELEDIHNLGHKWPLPQKPYPGGFNVKKRYHAVVEQITRLMMRDGKLATAQRNLAMTMNFLRMAPEPTFSPKFPLLPGTPPASHLPLNPILYLTVAIDSVAPLIRVKAIANAGGGGRALDMPQPLTVRQRRRRAFTWILEAVERRPSKGSGRTQFAHRLAEEIVAVVEGRSSVWEKRRLVHKQGTTARANVEKKVMVKKSVSK